MKMRASAGKGCDVRDTCEVVTIKVESPVEKADLFVLWRLLREGYVFGPFKYGARQIMSDVVETNEKCP